MNTISYRYIKIHSKFLEISNTANQIKYLSFKNHNPSKPRLKKGLAPLKISIMDSNVCVVSSKFWERTEFCDNNSIEMWYFIIFKHSRFNFVFPISFYNNWCTFSLLLEIILSKCLQTESTWDAFQQVEFHS
jgi:hypothetical protein